MNIANYNVYSLNLALSEPDSSPLVQGNAASVANRERYEDSPPPPATTPAARPPLRSDADKDARRPFRTPRPLPTLVNPDQGNLAQPQTTAPIPGDTEISPHLGLFAQTIPDGKPGLSVKGVLVGGPTEKAGIQTGDLITSINNVPAMHLRQIEQWKGATIPVTVMRGDVQMTLALQVE